MPRFHVVTDVSKTYRPSHVNHGQDLDLFDFAKILLKYLVALGGRDLGRRAHLKTALDRARLSHDPETVNAALALLENTRLISEITPLYDGGVLVTVSTLGIETAAIEECWATLRPC